MSPTKRPNLPDTRDPRFLEAVKETVQGMVGQRGDPLDKTVSFRDLLDAGVVEAARRFTQLPTGADPVQFLRTVNPRPETTRPTSVTNFRATGGYRNVLLTWGQPTYSNHAFTEIYRSTIADFGSASLVGTSPSRAYTDAAGSGETYWYFARHVSTGGVEGPIAGPAKASTAVDAEYIADVMQGKVDQSMLTEHLVSEIEKIELLEGLSSDVLDLIGLDLYSEDRAVLEGEYVRHEGAIYRALENMEPPVPAPPGPTWQTVGEYDSLTGAVDAQALQISDHDTRITNNEDGLSAQAQTINSIQVSITNLEDSVDSKASITYVDQAVAEEASARSTAVQQLETSIDENSSAIETKAETSVVEDLSGEVESIRAEYTVKLDVNGRVSGFGLTSDENASVFAVAANQMYFVDPNFSGSAFDPEADYSSLSALYDTQFIMGYATIDGTPTFSFNVPVAIPQASISYAQINTATIDELNVTQRATLVNTMLEGVTSVFTLNVQQNQGQQGGRIQSEDFQPGDSGFQLLAGGDAEFNNVRTRGLLYNGVLDSSGDPDPFEGTRYIDFRKGADSEGDFCLGDMESGNYIRFGHVPGFGRILVVEGKVGTDLPYEPGNETLETIGGGGTDNLEHIDMQVNFNRAGVLRFRGRARALELDDASSFSLTIRNRLWRNGNLIEDEQVTVTNSNSSQITFETDYSVALGDVFRFRSDRISGNANNAERDGSQLFLLHEPSVPPPDYVVSDT